MKVSLSFYFCGSYFVPTHRRSTSIAGDAADRRDDQLPPLDFGGSRRLRRPGFSTSTGDAAARSAAAIEDDGRAPGADIAG
jgi:hypothetical protein